MKRFLALVLVAFVFALTAAAPVSHAVAAPVGDPGAGKPVAAMDNAMKDSKDTAATDADKTEAKAKPAKKHGKHHGKKGHKKAAAADAGK